MIGFQGQVAIVTGAGAGIGRETALLLARRGAAVVVNDPAGGGELAETLSAQIHAEGGQAVPEASAVGTPGSGEAIAACALAAFGRIDILINNAGISRPASFGEDSDADIDLVFAVNLRGPYQLMRAVWPVMRKQGYGRILNTASSAALGSGISGAYAPSKAGIIGLTKEAAISGRAHNILVNAIMPSAHTILLDKHPDLAFRAWMKAYFPAALVAATSAYLVSREMSASGAIFATGGGLVQRVAFHETRGILDPELTPERLHARFAEVIDTAAGDIVAFQSDHNTITRRHFPQQ